LTTVLREGARRLLAEAKMEARRLIEETRSALNADGVLLNQEGRNRISTQITSLEDLLEYEEDRDVIDVAQETLQRIVRPFAQKRMDKAIGSALKGTNVKNY
jgi:molecular chaperone HscA